jgi:LacI family transcriptional regulator
MSATLSDIARETNTSVSTVSRVLAGGAVSKRISKETRDKVHEAAKRLGYRPNLLARSLRTRKSHTVALLVSDIANPWFGQLASTIEKNLHDQGYSLFLCNSAEDMKRETEYLHLLPQKGIDGLILVPLLKSKKALQQHLPANLPVVIVDRPVPGVNATVASDQDMLATQLADSLVRIGVKTIAMAHGPGHVASHRRRAEILASRFQVVAAFEGPSKRETGQAAMKDFLSKGLKADAYVGTNLFLTMGLLDELDIPAVGQQALPAVGCVDQLPFMDLLPMPVACAIQDIPGLADAVVKELMPLLQPNAVEPKPMIVPTLMSFNRSYEQKIKELNGGLPVPHVPLPPATVVAG